MNAELAKLKQRQERAADTAETSETSKHDTSDTKKKRTPKAGSKSKPPVPRFRQSLTPENVQSTQHKDKVKQKQTKSTEKSKALEQSRRQFDPDPDPISPEAALLAIIDGIHANIRNTLPLRYGEAVQITRSGDPRHLQVGTIALDADARGFLAVHLPATPNELHYYHLPDLSRPDSTSASAVEPIDADAVVPLLLKVLQNVVTHPAEPKYRKLKTTNRKVLRLWSDARVRQLLGAAGFRERDGVVLLRSTSSNANSRSSSGATPGVEADVGADADAGAGADVDMDAEALDEGQLFFMSVCVEQVQQALLDNMRRAEEAAQHHVQRQQIQQQLGGRGGGGGLVCCVCSRPDLFEDEYHKPGTFLMRARSVRSAIHCVECGDRADGTPNYVICGDCYNRKGHGHDPSHLLEVRHPPGHTGYEHSRYADAAGGWGSQGGGGFGSGRPPPPPPPGRTASSRGRWGR